MRSLVCATGILAAVLIIPARAQESEKMRCYHLIMEGDGLRNKGSFAEAEEKYMEALKLTKRLTGQKSSIRISIFPVTILDSYDRLGELYLMTGNLKRAESFYAESRTVREACLPPRSVFVVPPVIGLGEVSLARGNLDHAIVYFEEALRRLNRATTSHFNYEVFRKPVLLNQFEIYLRQGNLSAARKTVEKLSVGGQGTSSTVSSGAAFVSSVFEIKARYFLYRGEYEQAARYLTKANTYLKDDPAVLFRILRTEALLRWAEGSMAEAARSFEELIAGYKSHIARNLPAMNEYEREAFITRLKSDFDVFHAFAVEQFLSAGDAAHLEQVLTNQLFGKALLLNTINKVKASIQESDDPELKAQLVTWEEEKAKLASMYFDRKSGPDAVLSAEAYVQELERTLNRRSRLFSAVDTNVDWKAVRDVLKPEEAAVEIIRVRTFNAGRNRSAGLFELTDTVQYLVAILRPQQRPEFYVMENGNLLEGRYMQYYRNSIQSLTYDTLSYRHFWLPVAERLRGVRRIYLSADGVFNQVNLNTLYNASSGIHVLDEVELVQVTNCRDLLARQEVPSGSFASLYGRPTYRLDSAAVDQINRSGGGATRGLRAELMEEFREASFSDLPGTEIEISEVATLLKSRQWAVNENFRDRANEVVMKKERSPTVLHIATHGFFLPEKNEAGVNSMMRSGLILSGVNNTGSLSEDGILTAYEATSLSLDSTYLVVLSACETGLGEIRNGEGVYGLQRGFAVAGARYLLMSLWKVDDEATAFLMESFYKHWLEGEAPVSALRRAQSKLRSVRPQPFYWGAFVVLGH
jgi:CHAT domain-containing protein/tetratricopeptide (TPR) repeat protein